MQTAAATAAERQETTRLFAALARFGDLLLFGLVPLAFLGNLGYSLLHGYHGFDFVEYWDGGRAVLAGHSPYPSPALLTTIPDRETFRPFAYPAPFALAMVPFSLLPVGVANALFVLLGVAAVVAALRILGVRDLRCYGAALASLPVIDSAVLGAVSPFLLLGTAALWRRRDRPLAAGALLGILIALKLFLWPLAFWLVATRRFRATAWSVAVAGGAALAAWAAIGFAGLREYPALLGALTSLMAVRGYGPYGLVLALGGSATLAHVVLLAGGGLLAGACLVTASRPAGDRRAFAVALAAALFLTPILWPQYLALLLVPIALTSRRMSPLWLVPIALWLCAPAWSNGRLVLIVPVLALASLVLCAASASPERRL